MANKEEQINNKNLSRGEADKLLNDVQTIRDLRAITDHTYNSNVWGETDIPETKWFTTAKNAVLKNGDNKKFKLRVEESLADLLRGWTDSLTELKASLETIVYVTQKLKENPDWELTVDDYVDFLTHRVVIIALTNRLSLADPEKIPNYDPEDNE